MGRWAGTTTQRGYGSTHQRTRNALLSQWKPGDPCTRCGLPMWDKSQIDLGHDHVNGGYAGLEHSNCNRSEGAARGNKSREFNAAVSMVDRRVTCKMCEQPYSYAAQNCQICGRHYHPNRKPQYTCSRACGLEYKRRTYGYTGRPAAPKTPCEACGEPCAARRRFCDSDCAQDWRDRWSVRKRWPSSRLQYYNCRYCFRLGVTTAQGQRREVCLDELCQAQRLNDNREQHDGRPRPVAIGLRLSDDADRRTRFAAIAMDALPLTMLTARATWHLCPSCGNTTANHRWCDGCLCTSRNSKGRRCGNGAVEGGRCEHHAAAMVLQS